MKVLHIDGINKVKHGNHISMISNSKFGKVSWRKYLIAEYHPRVKKFLEVRGDDVFSQITMSIHNAIKTNKKEIAMLVHPHVNNVIVIEKKEYSEVLKLAMNHFIKKEDYMACSEIKEVQKLINRKKTQSKEILSKKLI